MGWETNLNEWSRCGMRLLFIVGFSAFASASAAQTSRESAASTPDRVFQAAIDARDRGNLEEAKKLLSKLRVEHPGIFAVDESLGLIYVAQQKYAEALPLLKAAMTEQPSSDVAHANLGAAFYQLGRENDARREFEEAARLNPANPETQQSMGELWLSAGNPERALAAFKAALKVKPEDANLAIDCARAMVAVGRIEDARTELTRLAGGANSGQAEELYGEIAEKEGDYQAALEHFSRALELDPTEANAWALDVELLRHWSFNAAVPELVAAVARFPSSTRLKLGLGAAYFGDAKYAEAIPVFADLLREDADNARYAEMLGMSCTAVTESAKQNCSVLLAYARKHPRDAKAATYAASMLLTDTADAEKVSTARALLNQALTVDPKSANAQYQMGMLKQSEGNWVGSVENLQAAIAQKPELAQAHYRLALAYWRSGKKQEGKEEMELQKKYAKQEKEDMDKRLHQITTFVVDVQ